jgi:hypothetical protein
MEPGDRQRVNESASARLVHPKDIELFARIDRVLDEYARFIRTIANQRKDH